MWQFSVFKICISGNYHQTFCLQWLYLPVNTRKQHCQHEDPKQWTTGSRCHQHWWLYYTRESSHSKWNSHDDKPIHRPCNKDHLYSYSSMGSVYVVHSKSSKKLNHIFCSTACIHGNRAGMMSQMKNAECVVTIF